jgi:hypothetical protein
MHTLCKVRVQYVLNGTNHTSIYRHARMKPCWCYLLFFAGPWTIMTFPSSNLATTSSLCTILYGLSRFQDSWFNKLSTKQSCYHFQSMQYLIWSQQIPGFKIQQIKYQAILLPLPVCSILYGLSRLQDSWFNKLSTIPTIDDNGMLMPMVNKVVLRPSFQAGSSCTWWMLNHPDTEPKRNPDPSSTTTPPACSVNTSGLPAPNKCWSVHHSIVLHSPMKPPRLEASSLRQRIPRTDSPHTVHQSASRMRTGISGSGNK